MSHPIWHNGSVKNELKPSVSAKPIKLMLRADEGHGLFLPDGATTPELLGLSAELCTRFNDWLKLHEGSNPAPDHGKQARYYGRGRRLAEEIAEALKASHRVCYRYLTPYKRPGTERHWEEDEIAGIPVVELLVSAWHPCSVWRVGGGLQSRLEDLPIPPKFDAKLAAWRKKYDSNCGEPSYSSRKEHDAEGQVIAAELQHAVSNQKIHVVFRHWVEFDPEQWRSFWREENLFTGQNKEFWLEMDLPDDLAIKVLRICPDAAGTYLWDLDAYCVGVEVVGGTEEFDERFSKWASRFNDCQIYNPSYKIDRERLAAEHFDERGLALAAELKRIAGDKARIFYGFTLKKTDAEILADGSIKESPRDTDYRQWAVDQRKT